MDVDITVLSQLIDKLGLVGVLVALLWLEKRQSSEWQARYTALSEKLLEQVIKGQ